MSLKRLEGKRKAHNIKVISSYAVIRLLNLDTSITQKYSIRIYAFGTSVVSFFIIFMWSKVPICSVLVILACF